MITGFNTDIEHEGVVYHVQTEDKGLDSPFILSLVYSGGAILASKRSRYEDLIESGFDEKVLAQRVKRQHRLICAAINAGRLEELKRMGARAEPEVSADDTLEIARPPKLKTPVGPETIRPETAAPMGAGKPSPASEVSVQPPSALQTPPVVAAMESTYTGSESQGPTTEAEVEKPGTGLALTVLDEEEFRAGESFTIRVLVENRGGKKEKPLNGVAVSVKILGTTFRPQIYSVKTERDGVAVVSTTMPNFTSGRAAVLIRAVAYGETTEVRRVIHPAQ